jgi:hypothetical protein
VGKTKKCTKCCIEKPISDFYPYKGTERVSPYCKRCTSIIRAAHYESNAASIHDARKREYQSNKSAILQKCKEYRAKTANDRKAYEAMRYKRDAEKRIAYVKDWRARNPDKARAIARRGKANRRSRPHYGLSERMATRMRRSLVAGKNGRAWRDIAGYGVDELRAHLERQFTKGMGWHNMGDWHIDHILPLASFPYESEDDPQFKRAWSLANLRPIWASENHRKNARIEFLL